MAATVIESFTSALFGASNDTLVLTKPTGVSSGDLLMLLVGNEDATTSQTWPTTRTGWTSAGRYDTATHMTMAMYWRIADGTEGASESIQVLSGSDYGGGFYLRINNYDASTTFDYDGTHDPIPGYNTSLRTYTYAPCGFDLFDDGLVIAFFSFDGGSTTFSARTTNGWSATIPTDHILTDFVNSNGWKGMMHIKTMIGLLNDKHCYVDTSTTGQFMGMAIGIRNGTAGGGGAPSSRRIYNI